MVNADNKEEYFREMRFLLGEAETGGHIDIKDIDAIMNELEERWCY